MRFPRTAFYRQFIIGRKQVHCRLRSSDVCALEVRTAILLREEESETDDLMNHLQDGESSKSHLLPKVKEASQSKLKALAIVTKSRTIEVI
jgi:hypothetical protein